MIVPDHWAEARVQLREAGRQFTVRRFGWSETTQGEAQAMAEQRAQAALARIHSGEKLERREPRVAYNGAQGVPIREEVLQRHGSAVLTRNSYGAVCLNTPEVLFADLDFDAEVSLRFFAALFGALLALFLLAYGLGLWPARLPLWAAFVLPAGLAISFGARVHRALIHLAGGHEARARRRIRRFVAAHPEWGLRVYRTPKGLRLLATHRVFDAREPAVAQAFTRLGVDPVYARMCERQHCFRARLTPKPWRVGMADHLLPRPGVWPIQPERLPARQAWVARYEQAAAGHAACRFEAQLGVTMIDARVQRVVELHDRLSGSLGTQPIA